MSHFRRKEKKIMNVCKKMVGLSSFKQFYKWKDLFRNFLHLFKLKTKQKKQDSVKAKVPQSLKNKKWFKNEHKSVLHLPRFVRKQRPQVSKSHITPTMTAGF